MHSELKKSSLFTLLLLNVNNCYSQKLEVAIHSFVLMTNHVHLLMTPKEGDGVSLLMQFLGRYYVRYINQKYQRSGTLWEGRYKSTLIDSEQYLMTVSRYIELNPVRAEMVEQPGEYPWSSFRGNALGTPIKLITPHDVYQALAKTDKTRQKRYLALFEKTLSEYSLEEIRQSVNRGWVLGNTKFKKQVEKKSGRRVSPSPRGGDRKSAAYKKNQLH